MSDSPSPSLHFETFRGASNFSVNELNQTDNSVHFNLNKTPGRPGLERLLAHSMRDAFHDSSDRWPPPQCHYNSRQGLRIKITDWATGREAQPKLAEVLLWMYGPFGVGKSAIAQTCADTLAEEDALGGSLFFSRPNNRNNPNYVFPSLVYQFALNSPEFANLVDQIIQKRPTLLTAARRIQFEELIVKPLREAAAKDPRIKQWTVILDGLDEVEGIDAQCDIINIVAASIRDSTTPFRWLIVSRPEPHIQRAMRAEGVAPLLSELDIPLSPKDDHEILKFFTIEVGNIRKQYNLPASWCSEAELATLVRFASGLWICVHTVVRFIGSSKSLGPTEQLRLVLSVAEKSSSRSSTNPLAAMDPFYDLIMQQIPSDVVSTIRKILLLNKVFPTHMAEINHVLELANVLGLSPEGFYAACNFLQSVLSIRDHSEKAKTIRFYHASFMDYMSDKQRSTEFCIYGDCLEELQQEVIRRINDIHSQSQGNTPVTTIPFPRPPPHNKDDPFLVYCPLVRALFPLCEEPNCVVSPSTADLLMNVQFSRIPELLKNSPCNWIGPHVVPFMGNLPIEYRDKIIRRSFTMSIPGVRWSAKPGSYILGQGKGKLVCRETL
ncbi:hypothetical protein NP233_g11143 [Leucocoprinus birnbaumii]|uniref:Nephrocystin 3-like N-terminal domain-containing protein n=1 Tax=Leucocoprinus birnbaumii TaxID=56174 RepID=A0AAD5YKP3_9AGAR|nr:hypothetical protein NP233_g11143 [Leucocoprinus birnbaumii]